MFDRSRLKRLMLYFRATAIYEGAGLILESDTLKVMTLLVLFVLVLLELIQKLLYHYCQSVFVHTSDCDAIENRLKMQCVPMCVVCFSVLSILWLLIILLYKLLFSLCCVCVCLFFEIF
jgi:hypothetical protein